MPVRVTSRVAYKEITDDGTKGNQAQTILMTVRSCTISGKYRDMSLREIKHSSVGYDINAISGRVNELKKSNMLITCQTQSLGNFVFDR
jgi:hypothetical protein